MNILEFLGGDFTPIEHVIYGTLIQAIVTAALWWFSPLLATGAGAGAVIGLYFGREHAQQQRHAGNIENAQLGVWQAARFWKWDYPSKMDLYCPAASALLLALVALVLA